MDKHNYTAKERDLIGILALIACISGAATIASMLALFSDKGSTQIQLIVFLISLSLCIGTIVGAIKIGKAARSRNSGAQLNLTTSIHPKLYCDNCGTKLESGVKFCSTCGQKVGNVSAPAVASYVNSGRKCPRCSSPNITYQTITEARKTGCGTILLYMFMTFTVFGLLIVIPLMLRKKTDTVTYAVCQNCGSRWPIK